MKILTAQQVRDWDAYTVNEQGITSLQLMERAANACVEWLLQKFSGQSLFFIFCGRGNNGGDGLAVARLLHQSGFTSLVWVLHDDKPGSADFEANLQSLRETGVEINFIANENDIPALPNETVVIDALFGSGLNRPLEGIAKAMVERINESRARVVSVDIPSGLAFDKSSSNNPVIKADHTLTFECYKLALLVQENAEFVGAVHVLPIALSERFLEGISVQDELLNDRMIRGLFRPRQRFAHKGTFGHALLVGGSWGKMGAALLATKACLRTGAGLTTSFVPKCGYNLIQSGAPEAMTITDESDTHLHSFPADLERFTAVGLGPGMDTTEGPQKIVSFMVRRCKKPMVIDADGLNCLALQPVLLQQLRPGTVLTPHPKEFDRLFGEHKNDFDRIATAKQKAVALNVVIILKGHHTLIALPNGRSYFNSTGNAGMAKGGSGDVLTGVITALLAQGYQPADASRLGVYIHGWAGDIAAKRFSKQALLPSQLVDVLADVFLELEKG